MTPRPIARWVGSALRALVTLQMLFSVLMNWWLPQGVPEHYAELGWSLTTMRVVGVVELACTLAYLAPRFSVVGAILLTGYLGGAVATHVRVGDGQMAYPLTVGLMLWLGLWLREPRLRPLLSVSAAAHRTAA